MTNYTYEGKGSTPWDRIFPFISLYLTLLNSIIDPIILAWRTQKIKKAIFSLRNIFKRGKIEDSRGENTRDLSTVTTEAVELGTREVTVARYMFEKHAGD